MIETGVIHGRFQVLHNDHLTYLNAGRERCRHLVIGITNPDPMLTRKAAADPARSDPLANPLTFFERHQMIRNAMVKDAGWSFENFSIVPMPINFPELYSHYVPLNATFFLTIYDDWGREKLRQFEALGLEVDVLWKRSQKGKGISGTEVRKRMAQEEPWAHMVPATTSDLMIAWGIPERLRRLRSS
ncbi:nicotinate-nucleotide adenylyltransferase [Acidobacteriota bacterium]